MLSDQAMQQGPPHPHARSAIRKFCFDRKRWAEKTNASERVTILRLQRNPKLLQSGNAIGHQAFAARFVDRHLCAIGHDHAKSLLTRGNRRRQPRRTATNHEYVS